ncbi:MAG: dimethylsulfonioproprionate lyase family protein [Pseudomonadota bacterium]
MDGGMMESAADQISCRLADEPDWRYLLREVYELYRNSGAGGSEAIRRHQRVVREAVSRAMKNPSTPILERVPEQKPVNKHLKRAFDLGRFGRQSPMIYAIENVQDRLAWLYGYDKVPRGLIERFAWCEFAGPQGPIQALDVIVGQVLFAPGTTYPSHAHAAIAESYFILSGSVSFWPARASRGPDQA